MIHRKNAMLVPAGDWSAFAEAIREVDSDVGLRRALSEGGKQALETATGETSLLDSLSRAYLGHA